MKESLERNIKTRMLSMLFQRKFTIYVASFISATLFSYIIYTPEVKGELVGWLSSFVVYYRRMNNQFYF